LQNNKNSPQKINLLGVGIGDGWVNPYYQAGSYAPFLYRNDRIDYAELEIANGLYLTYKGLIDIGAYITAQTLGNILLESVMVEGGIGDVYDIRKANDPTDGPAAALNVLLNNPAVIKLLNASGATGWQMCGSKPYIALLDDMARSSEFLVPAILKEIPVLFYNGNYDLICNMDGTATLLSVLNWPYQSQFNNAKRQPWITTGAAGWYQAYSNLIKLVIYNAGHMVPFDQPQNSYEMLMKFIGGGFKP